MQKSLTTQQEMEMIVFLGQGVKVVTRSFPCLKSLGHLLFPNLHKTFDTGVAIIIFQRLYILKKEKIVNAAICASTMIYLVLPKMSHDLCY